ncbi:putative disease resistance RPP13-like protein 1 isoform X1 [Ziziphus jujuba]|uniref:Disease resistance RPP13-like protein 1 isoform X1 n=1 Tax=Ziziphus jujuba TaxID=326968 RepID=A0ABM3IJS7_ZIZJJ|nr:putative disease resistance RPP13-like protein 1 isoform X1 [Ziziphus jujuba]XP_048329905.2 putative disease resistance RPP13-like protein 1 isoform X1 [Ziziphus jujuba]
MAVGEIFLAAFLQILFERLMSSELLNFARREGVQEKLKKWRTMLSTIQAVLCDAEEKQLTSKAVNLWLDDLRDLAYDVEDILDKFSTELLRRKIEKLHQASTSKAWCLIPPCCTCSSSSGFGWFMYNLDSEINEITERLQDISRRKNELGLNDIGRSVIEWKRPPSSSLPDGPVIGRDEDKKKMIELLIRDEQSLVNFDVASIVGMPGVGKTTLAGLVFNDDAMKHFDIKVWVSVSDDFNCVRLTKAILKSITLKNENFDEFSEFQDLLSEVLAGKKFLIVLDDVWNTNYGLWATLQSPFRAAAPGSKIIVTTRDINVAKLMGAVECYNLECVSDDDCWKVFVQHAFLNRNISEPPNLRLLREKIVSKCNGLPLAAGTLGGLLRCKEIDEWEDILNCKLWTQLDQSNILPLLRLSYHYLPSHLKRCFAYCSILPKDYEFEEKQLILLWMAEGLIQQLEGSKQMEDLGSEYFNELLSRSFFQKSRKDKTKYVMHDLMNDLAQWVAGEIGFGLEDKLDSNNGCWIFPKARHSSYISAKFDGIQRLGAFSKVKYLRTFLPLTEPHGEEKYITSSFTLDILPKFQYLRVLSLNSYNISKLPDSIGELKHLRYLDLSYTNISSLPQSIITLYNLQTLLLECCYDLNELPTGMENLTNLRHLNSSNLWSLKAMPRHLGKLTNLQTLSYFVVGKDSGTSGVGELGPLLHLRGMLHISGLENVTGAEDAAMANLVVKNGIDVLLMQWNDRELVDTDVFEMLQPSSKLKELTVMGYGGQKFPSWIANPSFSNMVVMRLERCTGCTLLPPLGLLISLKKLIIRRMPKIESIGSEFYGEGCLRRFPSLETLSFEDMENWKDWFPVGTGIGIEVFPKLKELFLRRCPKLEGKLPDNLPSLAKLVIGKCDQLVVSIPSHQMLNELNIDKCKELVRESNVELKSLRSICLNDISNFRHPTEGFMQGLIRVEDLKVVSCREMASWQDELQQLISLRCLEIEDSFEHFTSIGEETGQVQSWIPSKVESMKLENCHNLLKILEGLHLTFLQELYIVSCPSFISFAEAGLPASLRVIFIGWCNSFSFLARSQVPPALKRLTICFCHSLQTLIQEEDINSTSASFLETLIMKGCPSLMSISTRGNLPARLKHLQIRSCDALKYLSSDKLPTTLEHLEIKECGRLTHLSSNDELPQMLKHLQISDCGNLESIADRFQDNTCLESIKIIDCPKLESLPEGLHLLTNLSKLHISWCDSLVSFPEGGLPTSSLRYVSVTFCGKLKAFPTGMNGLSSLNELRISSCEGCASLLEDGFPPSIASLFIWNFKVTKPFFKWGLQRLTSLRELVIRGKASDMVCFPPEEQKGVMLLPKSLIDLKIFGFPNLEYLSTEGFRCLTSLEYLTIGSCGKLKSFPKEGSTSFTFETSNL